MFCDSSRNIKPQVDKSIIVDLKRCLQNSIDVSNKESSHKMLNLFDYYGYVNSSNLCAKLSCKFMLVRMKFESFEYVYA